MGSGGREEESTQPHDLLLESCCSGCCQWQRKMSCSAIYLGRQFFSMRPVREGTCQLLLCCRVLKHKGVWFLFLIGPGSGPRADAPGRSEVL